MRTFILCIGLMVSCASRLPYHPPKAPSGDSQVFRTDEISFTDIQSKLEVNLGKYLADGKLSHILLIYGSMACSSCNEKNEKLKKEVVGQHPLWFKKDFRILAVNVDTADRLEQLKHYTLANHYDPFLKWQDSSAAMLLKYFMPKDETFGIPFIALVEPNKIDWYYRHDQPINLDIILKRVSEELGTDNPTPPPSPTPTPTTTPPPKSRFDSIPYRDTTLASVVKKDAINFLLVAKTTGSDFEQDKKELTRACANRCGVTVVTNAETDLVKYFINPWRRHFDWHYRPIENPDYSLTLPDIAGPLVMGFSPDERLIYSLEGKLVDGSMDAYLNDPEFVKGTARGVDFPLYPQSFAPVRLQTQYTIFITFSLECTGCRDELRSWNQPGRLFSKCAASGKCQTVVLENGADSALDVQMKKVKDALAKDGLSLPILLDPHPFDDYLGRVFDGYLTAEFPEWKNQFGVVVYDKEGRIVLGAKTGDGGFEAECVRMLEQP